MSLHAVPLQDLVAFRQTTAEDELEETVQDEDLESNKELLLLSLGRARNLARNGLKVYIYISNLSHELRCLPVFENTGHIWNLPSLQKCFAKLYEESWLGFACAVPAHHAQPFIRCAKAQDEDNATSKKYAINALAVRGMAT